MKVYIERWLNSFSLITAETESLPASLAWACLVLPPPLPVPLGALLSLPNPAGNGTRVPQSPLAWTQQGDGPSWSQGGRLWSETEERRCELAEAPANGVVKYTPEPTLHANVPAVAGGGYRGEKYGMNFTGPSRSSPCVPDSRADGDRAGEVPSPGQENELFLQHHKPTTNTLARAGGYTEE